MQLPTQFDGRWPEEKLPYRVLTWDLADSLAASVPAAETEAGLFGGSAP